MNRFRRLDVPVAGRGMRLDRFLARWFHDLSRATLVKGIKAGQVRSDGRVLRPSTVLRGGEVLEIFIPGIAPSSDPPPFPPVLFEDERVVVVDKPAGMLAHPAGTRFAWAVTNLARMQWPDVDLVHRLDRETSGTLALTKDGAANAFLKDALLRGEADKTYLAITRGDIAEDEQLVDAPIGSAGGPIRIQMGVRSDGLEARTEVTVLGRRQGHCLVRCHLLTGRTHQIRVHLAHLGAPVLGDKMYATPLEVALEAWNTNVFDAAAEAAGAPRQALHAARLKIPHPEGGDIDVAAPMPADMSAWWDALQP